MLTFPKGKIITFANDTVLFGANSWRVHVNAQTGFKAVIEGQTNDVLTVNTEKHHTSKCDKTTPKTPM